MPKTNPPWQSLESKNAEVMEGGPSRTLVTFPVVALTPVSLALSPATEGASVWWRKSKGLEGKGFLGQIHRLAVCFWGSRLTSLTFNWHICSK